MHLVYKALEKTPVPQSLPPQLVPPSKRGKGAPVIGGVPVLPTVAARDSPVQRADSPAVSRETSGYLSESRETVAMIQYWLCVNNVVQINFCKHLLFETQRFYLTEKNESNNILLVTLNYTVWIWWCDY